MMYFQCIINTLAVKVAVMKQSGSTPNTYSMRSQFAAPQHDEFQRVQVSGKRCELLGCPMPTITI